jgi:hypothetical protein
MTNSNTRSDHHPESPSRQDHGPNEHRPTERWTFGRVLKFLFFFAVAGLLLKAGSMIYRSRTDGIPLAIKWEGAFLNANTRDVGTSINQCLGRPLLREGVLQRSNVWFSGWSCDKVGSPDVIFSLNFDPARNERYFCRTSKTNVIGMHYGQKVLHDLEFLETWTDSEMRHTTCQYLEASFTELISGKKVLVHCDAGRDRTGTYSALIAALTAESMGRLNEEVIEAIECDYQKTRSLHPSKIGRMRHFIEDITAEGGTIRDFLIQQCKMSPQLIQAVTSHMAATN